MTVCTIVNEEDTRGWNLLATEVPHLGLAGIEERLNQVGLVARYHPLDQSREVFEVYISPYVAVEHLHQLIASL